MLNIFIQKPIVKEQESLFHMLWFAEAWIEKGYMPVNEKNGWINTLYTPLPKKIKLAFISILCALKKNKKKYLITPMSGFSCLLKVFPYCFNYEIIPYIWDCWPICWNRFSLLAKVLKPKICFVSSSIICKQLAQQNKHVRFFYIPEGIKPSVYIAGKKLKDRNYDILELGRIHQTYHEKIIEIENIDIKYNSNGKHVYPTFASLVNGLSNTKIVICFPRSDTHSMAGGIETLTQRYWECMLSKCLILGRAPFELVELLGYNPVVNIEEGEEKQQLVNILTNINDYQYLVDKNYESAIKYSSWESRQEEMIKIIHENINDIS